MVKSFTVLSLLAASLPLFPADTIGVASRLARTDTRSCGLRRKAKMISVSKA